MWVPFHVSAVLFTSSAFIAERFLIPITESSFLLMHHRISSLPYSLLVLDVDGTILDSSHALRPRVVHAVRAARAAGLVVTLATGKLLPSVRSLIDAMGLDGPQITVNGAATLDARSGAALRFCPLMPANVRAVVETVRAADPDILVTYFTVDNIYMDHPHPGARILDEYGEGPPLLVPDLLSGDLPPAAKILLSGSPQQLASLRERVTPLLAERVSITTTTPDFLEFFDFAAGKGLALAALRETLHLPREAIIAVGDGENDVPLLQEAGLAVAMGNAAPTLREVAHHITASNDEDGLAVLIEGLLEGSLPLR